MKSQNSLAEFVSVAGCLRAMVIGTIALYSQEVAAWGFGIDNCEIDSITCAADLPVHPPALLNNGVIDLFLEGRVEISVCVELGRLGDGRRASIGILQKLFEVLHTKGTSSREIDLFGPEGREYGHFATGACNRHV